MWIAGILLFAVVARLIYVESLLKHSHLVRVRCEGWMTSEVRRRVGMEKLPEHVCAYPVPREERIQVSRLWGLPIWRRGVSIALPQSAVESLNSTELDAFDAHFPKWLRIDGAPRS